MSNCIVMVWNGKDWHKRTEARYGLQKEISERLKPR